MGIVQCFRLIAFHGSKFGFNQGSLNENLYTIFRKTIVDLYRVVKGTELKTLKFS